MVVLKGGRRIKLPAETRWCSYRDSFKSLIENLAHMKEISAATRKKIKPKVTELIFNDDFIDDVQKHLEIQDPICNLVNICQSADTSLADAVNMWLKLEVPEVFADKLNSRQEMALNVYALTAYFLHPTYDNSKLKSAHNAKINPFLFRQLDNQGIEEWDKFNTRTGKLCSQIWETTGGRLSECERSGAKIRSKSLNANAKRVATAELIVHKRRGQNFYKKLQNVQNLCQERLDVAGITFDFIQNLPLPNIPVQKIFYFLQLWVYAFEIHNLSDKSALF
nr:unnamed protein product [Callosobruchus chinensis]